MQIPILVEPVPGNGYRATAGLPLHLAADGATADEALSQLEELIKTLRVGNIICGIHVGDMPPDKTRHSTELFARNVMPHLKGIWKDYDSDEQSSSTLALIIYGVSTGMAS